MRTSPLREDKALPTSKGDKTTQSTCKEVFQRNHQTKQTSHVQRQLKLLPKTLKHSPLYSLKLSSLRNLNLKLSKNATQTRKSKGHEKYKRHPLVYNTWASASQDPKEEVPPHIKVGINFTPHQKKLQMKTKQPKQPTKWNSRQITNPRFPDTQKLHLSQIKQKKLD